jgi:HEAT repeat protein
MPRLLRRRDRVQILREFARNLEGASAERLAAVAEDTGLLRHARRRSLSRWWWRRLEAVRVLQALGTGREVRLTMLDDPHPQVRAQVAKWAALLPTSETADRLLLLLEDPAPLVIFAAQGTLISIGPPTIAPLAEYLRRHEGPGTEAAMRVACHLADPAFLLPALQQCHHESAQVRALAAHLAGALGGFEVTHALYQLLADPVPEVRAAAARALGSLGHWPAGSDLAGLLRDSAWVVRREAGLSLRALGAPGTLLLRRSLHDDDPFAADMARQVLDLPDIAAGVRR